MGVVYLESVYANSPIGGHKNQSGSTAVADVFAAVNKDVESPDDSTYIEANPASPYGATTFVFPSIVSPVVSITLRLRGKWIGSAHTALAQLTCISSNGTNQSIGKVLSPTNEWGEVECTWDAWSFPSAAPFALGDFDGDNKLSFNLFATDAANRTLASRLYFEYSTGTTLGRKMRLPFTPFQQRGR